jgi:hypothetical protein
MVLHSGITARPKALLARTTKAPPPVSIGKLAALFDTPVTATIV